MPRGKYSNLSVRREVREELERLREELKVNDLSDLLVLLVKTYREHTNIVSKLEEILTNIVSKAVREALSSLTNTVSTSVSGGAQATSASSRQHATQGSKRSAIEVLRDQKVTCLSDLVRAGKKNPEAIIESARRGGAIIVRTSEDTCAVEPGFWEEFRRKLSEVKSPKDEDVLSKLKDARMKRLFQLLRKAGALYLDSKSREWRFDPAFIEEPPRVEVEEVGFEGEELE